MAYDALHNHDREGANVLFGDGRVEFIQSLERVGELVRQTRERLAAGERPAPDAPDSPDALPDESP